MNKHPLFPNFKTLELVDKKLIEHITKRHDPYSDYNFFSLWGYMHTQCQWTTLDGNLVMMLIDYLDQKPFLSLLGETEIKRSMAILLDYAKQNNITPELKLISQSTIEKGGGFDDTFHILEDPDNHDYILDINQLATLKGKTFASKRRELNGFYRAHQGHHFGLVSVDTHKDKIDHIFHAWAKETPENDWKHEYEAMNRALTQKHIPYTIFFLEVDTQPAGFVVIEKLEGKYAMLHYWKADRTLTNAYAFLMHATARALHEEGYMFLNFQQDLGLDHLKEAKSRWHPIFHLKKFTVRSR